MYIEIGTTKRGKIMEITKNIKLVPPNKKYWYYHIYCNGREMYMKKLKGITWAHSRGFTSIVAVSQRYAELHPDIDITWEKRSLQEFADAPVEKLAEAYDLLIIDHPWAGFAAKHKILLPLQEYLSEEYLNDQAENSVGASHNSYNFDGYQSALAIDAATPIAVYRPDYFTDKKIPETFEEVLGLRQTGNCRICGDSN